jgi:GR25 family glycosyltransferase involved in LPS biosynthesis
MKCHKEITAFCINLNRRTDRWEKVSKEFAKIGWEVRRVSAVEYHKGIASKLRMGPAACMESHRRVWEMISQLDSEVAAVFEDDAAFPSDFREVFPKAYEELPEDWNVWHLHSFGPAQMKHLTILSEHITKLDKKGWGSHGYIIKKDFASKALDLSFEVTNLPVDMFLTYGISSRKFSSYGVLPKYTLCFQDGSDTDIPETKQNKYWTETRLQYNR